MADRLGDDLLPRMRAALAASDVTAGDLYVRRFHRGQARFALNSLGQHVDVVEQTVTARAGIPTAGGFRLAAVTTTDMAHDDLVRALRQARAIAERAPETPDWPGFAHSEEAQPNPPRYAASTAECTPAMRAELLAPAFAHAGTLGLRAAGTLETTTYEIAVANSTGTARAANGTIASLRFFAHDPDGNSGFAQQMHRDVTKLDVPAAARLACERCVAQKNPRVLPAGEYDVLLMPQAVTELLEWMAFIAFGARDVFDGTSPLAGRTGETISGPHATLIDDANDASDTGFGIPFDRDGVIRQRVVLIDRGIARDPVYDRLYAARMGKTSTGHAGPPGEFDQGPLAESVQLAAGSNNADQMLAGVKRGLFISRFHYVNGYLEPRRTLMTGLTRDGTFLVENGERVAGVRNMRFTESVLDAFARIDGISAARSAVRTWWSDAGAVVAPSLLIRGFRFSGGGIEPTR